jgi:hypothetical protein
VAVEVGALVEVGGQGYVEEADHHFVVGLFARAEAVGSGLWGFCAELSNQATACSSVSVFQSRAVRHQAKK